MRTIKNSYFRAILKVTSNGNFPEYSDLWRCYHPTALMLDSDYCLFSSGCESSEAVFGVAREGRSGSVQNRLKKLYVPVTRKVILTTEKKARKLHSGMN